jgi:hypothetical protein
VRYDYTAWKFGYVDSVMDLVFAARAQRLPLRGCDMPGPVQDRLRALSGPLRDSLRELHCLLALEQPGPVKDHPRRVAMFWGQAHLGPRGLPRFLPADALVVSLYLLGRRPGPLTPEAELARHLVVDDLLLLPLDRSDEQLALLLPGPPLGGELSRSREWTTSTSRGPARLRVSSQLPGELFVCGRQVRVGVEDQTLELPPQPSAGYLLRAGRLRMAGAVELRSGSVVELSFDPARRATRLHLALPRD